jgi:hypothetical protein
MPRKPGVGRYRAAEAVGGRSPLFTPVHPCSGEMRHLQGKTRCATTDQKAVMAEVAYREFLVLVTNLKTNLDPREEAMTREGIARSSSPGPISPSRGRC